LILLTHIYITTHFPQRICTYVYNLQVVILHHMLSKATVKARPSVLWCYKKELGFSRYVLIWKRNCLHRILYLKNIVCDIPKILCVLGEVNANFRAK
jgi:hypothetical protein